MIFFLNVTYGLAKATGTAWANILRILGPRILDTVYPVRSFRMRVKQVWTMEVLTGDRAKGKSITYVHIDSINLV